MGKMGKRPAAKVSHSRKKTIKTKAKVNKTSKAMKKTSMPMPMKAMKAMKAATAMKAMKVMKAVKTQVKRSSSSSTSKAVKAMKASKAMKAMKAAGAAKKKKGNPKVAVGRWAKWRVYVGWKEKTVGRLKKHNLKTNRRGRVVYKKMSDQAKERMKNSKISTWYQSVKEARQVLKLVGFVPVGGKTAAGQALLKQTKMIYYEHVYNISQKATKAMLQMMHSPSPSPPVRPWRDHRSPPNWWNLPPSLGRPKDEGQCSPAPNLWSLPPSRGRPKAPWLPCFPALKLRRSPRERWRAVSTRMMCWCWVDKKRLEGLKMRRI